MDNQDLIDDIEIEKSIKTTFGVDLEVDSVVARQFNVGKSAYATVFLSNKKQLYCYIKGNVKIVLGDVQKIVSRVGLKPELFFPPKGQPSYFNDIGRKKFKQVYPGRHDVSDSDIAFYRTLAPYCPALVLISEVKDGVLYCADRDARSGWRPVAKLMYRRIKTS